MNIKTNLLAAALLAVAGVGEATADAVRVVFDNARFLQKTPSGGEAIFTLQSDGTVRGTIVSFGGGISRFYFNSPSHQPSSQFSDADAYTLNAPTSNIEHMTALFGFYNSGWIDPTYNATTVSWIIGTPGSFKSAWDAFASNSMGHSVWFGGLNSNNPSDGWTEWTGKLVQAPVPEPEIYALMLLGLGAVGVAARRRKA